MTTEGAKGGPGVFGAANLLTFWRIALIPAFMALFLTDAVWAKAAALALAASFELSDMLDGWVARRVEGVSDFGALFDPFADHVSRFLVFLCFLPMGYAKLWMVAVVFFRDALVSWIRTWAARDGIVISARLSGKIKAVFQGTGILLVCVLALGQAMGKVDAAPATEIALWAMGVVAVATALSGTDYLLGNLHIFRRPPPA
jgi:CDP-diacylglycerol--glycerol-3-phosphate 3-phosphatidyltransferase